MNGQRRSDQRSLALHRAIARKLRCDPRLWRIPIQNMIRWKQRNGRLPAAIEEWRRIFDKQTQETILAILENDSEESIRLRSSSPFTGILNDVERMEIFASYRSVQCDQSPVEV